MPLPEDIEAAMQQACGQIGPGLGAVECDNAVPEPDYGYALKQTAKSLHKPSFRNNLAHQVQHHEAEVKRLKRLIHLLDSNPEVQEILELSKGF